MKRVLVKIAIEGKFVTPELSAQSLFIRINEMLKASPWNGEFEVISAEAEEIGHRLPNEHKTLKNQPDFVVVYE